MKFIPINQIKTLREDAKNGNELAIKILRAQMNGDDFSQDLDAYFSKPPVQEKESLPEKTKLQQFLEDNGVTEDDEDYDATVEMYYKEFPNERPNEDKKEEIQEVMSEETQIIDKLIKDEVEAIDSYSKGITQIMSGSTLNEMQKKRIIARFKEIRGDEEEHHRQLEELKAICLEQDEKAEEKAPQE